MTVSSVTSRKVGCDGLLQEVRFWHLADLGVDAFVISSAIQNFGIIIGILAIIGGFTEGGLGNFIFGVLNLLIGICC